MGLIHLDAGVIIGFLNGDDAHHGAALAALSDALDQNHQMQIAASALAECLVGPARNGTAAITVVHDMLGRLPVSVVHLDAEIATRAAVLRSRHRGLKLPDALVIATAAHTDADRLITTDRKWPTAKAMKLTVAIVQIGTHQAVSCVPYHRGAYHSVRSQQWRPPRRPPLSLRMGVLEHGGANPA